MDTTPEATAEGGLFTCSYTAYRPSMGVPVQTSVGYPRFWSKAKNGALDKVPALYPDELRTMSDEAAFVKAYRAKLDGREVDVLRQLVDASARHPGQPLVLLCYEDLTKAWCHRTTAAAWLTEKLTIPVLELGQPHAHVAVGSYDPIDDARRRKVAQIVARIENEQRAGGLNSASGPTDDEIREMAALAGVRAPSETTIAMVREELAK